jgi:hypothetical protein
VRAEVVSVMTACVNAYGDFRELHWFETVMTLPASAAASGVEAG